MENKEIVVSGIRSTGVLHLGNYFGAMRNYVKMQEDYQCYFFVADLHSLTTHPEPKDLKNNVFRVLSENIACGLDPEKVALYAQSDVIETNELYLLLNMLAYKGELEKVPTFKDKVRQHPENVNAGLLTYPVLMAADILLHRATKVPVGKDQEQHLEMARNFAQRFNNRYHVELFPDPYPFNFGSDAIKLLSLDGNGKMSKSENTNATIFLNDSDEIIIKKIKKAKTDNGPEAENSTMPDYIANLFQLMELVSANDVVAHYKSHFNKCSIRYGDFKNQLAEDMVAFINPIRTKANDLEKNESYLQSVLKQGAEKAKISAANTIKQAREAIGIKYY